jgi:hypothetical protein
MTTAFGFVVGDLLAVVDFLSDEDSLAFGGFLALVDFPREDAGLGFLRLLLPDMVTSEERQLVLPAPDLLP